MEDNATAAKEEVEEETVVLRECVLEQGFPGMELFGVFDR